VLANSQKVATAWATSVNAAGGINGHPVNLIVKDDGSNPATALQDAKALVEQDHVMAIVGEISLADGAFGSYVATKGVPVVGGASPEPVQGSNPDFFPSGSPLLPLVIGTLAEAKGKKNLGAMYCAESPVCAQLIPLAQGIGKTFGLKVTPQKISGTAPNYTAPCLTMKSAGVDALYIADNGPIVQRVIAGCKQQGYTPLNVVQASTTTNMLLADPNLAGSLVAGTNANPYDVSLPAVKEFQDAVEKSYPGLLKSPGFAYDAYYPWTGGKLFEAAAKAANLTPSSTPADVKKGLYALKAETLGGLAPPLTYTPGKPYFTPCWFSSKIQGGTMVSLNNNKPVCLPADQAAALVTALHLG
jgi:branched-chain amino acid transport system substrate-binding protein